MRSSGSGSPRRAGPRTGARSAAPASDGGEVSGGRRHYRGNSMHIQDSHWSSASTLAPRRCDRRGGRQRTRDGVAVHAAARGRTAQPRARAARGARGLRRAGIRRADGGRGAPRAGRCRHGVPALPEQGRPGPADSRGGDLPADRAGQGGARAGGGAVAGAVALPADVGGLGCRAAAAAAGAAGRASRTTDGADGIGAIVVDEARVPQQRVQPTAELRSVSADCGCVSAEAAVPLGGRRGCGGAARGRGPAGGPGAGGG